MKPWWRRQIDEARVNADNAEQQQKYAVESTASAADAAVARAKKVGNQLRSELMQNGFADAMRSAFGGAG